MAEMPLLEHLPAFKAMASEDTDCLKTLPNAASGLCDCVQDDAALRSLDRETSSTLVRSAAGSNLLVAHSWTNSAENSTSVIVDVEESSRARLPRSATAEQASAEARCEEAPRVSSRSRPRRRTRSATARATTGDGVAGAAEAFRLERRLERCASPTVELAW